jgi:hypothetical protein
LLVLDIVGNHFLRRGEGEGGGGMGGGVSKVCNKREGTVQKRP